MTESAESLRAFRKARLADAHQSNRIVGHNRRGELKKSAALPFVGEVRAAPTTEVFDQTFHKGSAIAAGVGRFDLSGAGDRRQPGRLLGGHDQVKGRKTRERSGAVRDADGEDAAPLELLA